MTTPLRNRRQPAKTGAFRSSATDMNTDRVFLSGNPGFAECFNADPIEYGNGTTTSPARNLAGLVYGWTNGLLSLESHWFYEVVPKRPQKVLLNNALQGDWPYPSPGQTVDRVVELVVEGWEDVPLHLELIDPPDLAPYIAKDLDDPAGFTAFPYDAGDNVGEVAGEYGLTQYLRQQLPSQGQQDQTGARGADRGPSGRPLAVLHHLEADLCRTG